MSVTSGGVHEVCTVEFETLRISTNRRITRLGRFSRASKSRGIRFDICHVAALSLCDALFL